ncbi:MAG: PHP domain-containing protein [Acidobacteria bacterium]|nr:PHP domain-containing protein [Acidobacteriota bacterium]
MLKVELHAHTSEDPNDRIPHTAFQLVDRASELGFHALAITLHDKQLDSPDLAAYARDRGLLLIPGIERSIGGRHVLLINFPASAERVQTFQEIAALKQQCDGLVIAPHPFFPFKTCLREWMDRHPDLFDAVEFNHLYTRAVDFNRAALRWARKHGKTVVGNSDVHRLAQLGQTYTCVDAEPEVKSICRAIRDGRVQIETAPLSLCRAGLFVGQVFLSGWRRREPDPAPPCTAAPDRLF